MNGPDNEGIRGGNPHAPLAFLRVFRFPPLAGSLVKNIERNRWDGGSPKFLMDLLSLNLEI